MNHSFAGEVHGSVARLFAQEAELNGLQPLVPETCSKGARTFIDLLHPPPTVIRKNIGARDTPYSIHRLFIGMFQQYLVVFNRFVIGFLQVE